MHFSKLLTEVTNLKTSCKILPTYIPFRLTSLISRKRYAYRYIKFFWFQHLLLQFAIICAIWSSKIYVLSNSNHIISFIHFVGQRINYHNLNSTKICVVLEYHYYLNSLALVNWEAIESMESCEYAPFIW